MILKFRHLLERHHLDEGLLTEITHHLAAQGLRLRVGTIVDATILDAPASTKNRALARDPEMHQVKQDNQGGFRREGAHRGGRAHRAGAQRRDDGGECGGYHASAAAPPRCRDAGAGRRGRCGRGPAPGAPGPEDRLAGGAAAGAAADQRTASIRAKVEHPFWYVKRHVGYAPVRYRGLAKNRTRQCPLLQCANLLPTQPRPPTLAAAGSRLWETLGTLTATLRPRSSVDRAAAF